jgi:hypothetical protein
MRLHIWPTTIIRLSCLEFRIQGLGLNRGLLYAPLRRGYATQSTSRGSTTPSRKQITVVNDDGRVQWKDLSRTEKAARTTQQTFNFGLVLLGAVMTVRHKSGMEKSSSYKLGWCRISPLQGGLFWGKQDKPLQPRCRPSPDP